jgi:diguanylate cyclase (GGDEF)-like protein/PAS domain S-box-containing protein
MTGAVPPMASGDGRPHAEDLEDLLDLYLHAPCGYLTLDEELRVVRVNRTFLELTGRDEADVVGRLDWPALLRAGDRILFETHARPMLAAGHPVSAMAVELPRADGSRLSALVHLVPRQVRDRRLVRVTVFDATERRAYERELLHERHRAEAGQRQLQALFAVSRSLESASTVDEVAAAVTDGLTSVLRCADVDVWVVDGSVLSCIRSTQPEELRSAPFLALSGSGVLSEAARSGEILPWIPDRRVVPLRDRDRVGGVIALRSDDRTHELTDDLLQAFGHLAGGALARAVRFEAEAQARAHAELEAVTDTLTGIGNRRALDRELEAELARAARDGSTPALALIDIDRFKGLNDRYGHPTGDDVLVAVAQRLRDRSRVYDVVARWGGEEFAVLLRAVPGDDALASILEGFRAVIAREPVMTRSGPVEVTVSVGGARWRPWWRTSADLLSGADRALYLAKQNGRDRVEVDQRRSA